MATEVIVVFDSTNQDDSGLINIWVIPRSSISEVVEAEIQDNPSYGIKYVPRQYCYSVFDSPTGITQAEVYSVHHI